MTFDTVDHIILINKLTHYGLHDNTVAWIKSYLSNRTQKTRVNNCVSSEEFVTYGVPQGSRMGPLLFLLYVNDVNHLNKSTKAKLYADDLVLYSTENDVKNACQNVQEDLNRLSPHGVSLIS